MARYQVILVYDGTDFFGFQRQAEERTVQSVIESALCRIGWQGSTITAAGRTDSGVHATGQVVVFDLDWDHGISKLQSAINAYLPPDVAIQSIDRAAQGFHPRFDAVSRSYQYCIYSNEARNPLKDRYAWRVWPELELDRLKQAASLLQGEHDFAAFGTSPRTGGATIRYVFEAGWSVDGENLFFDITADAFLTHMVRRLVFHQVEIGRGNREIKSVEEYVKDKRNPLVQGLAPSQGLFLKRVNFPEE